MKRKRKKSNISISRTTLYTQKIKFCMQNFFFKNCLFEYENQFAGLKKKNTKKCLGAISKSLFCRRHQKIASHTFSIYGNFIISIFLTKNFSFLCSTIHRILCQNKKKVFWKFDDTNLAKFMKFVWLVFLHRLSLWNCMISIFGLWRSTRIKVINETILKYFFVLIFVSIDKLI